MGLVNSYCSQKRGSPIIIIIIRHAKILPACNICIQIQPHRITATHLCSNLPWVQIIGKLMLWNTSECQDITNLTTGKEKFYFWVFGIYCERSVGYWSVERNLSHVQIVELPSCGRTHTQEHGTVTCTEATSAFFHWPSEINRPPRLARVTFQLYHTRKSAKTLFVIQTRLLSASVDLMRFARRMFIQSKTHWTAFRFPQNCRLTLPLNTYRDWSSSFSIVTRKRTGGIMVRFQAEVRDFWHLSLSLSCLADKKFFHFSVIKGWEHEADHSPPSGTYSSTCQHGVQRDSFVCV